MKGARYVTVSTPVATLIDLTGDVRPERPGNHVIVNMAAQEPGYHKNTKEVIADFAETQVFETFGYLQIVSKMDFRTRIDNFTGKTMSTISIVQRTKLATLVWL